MALECSGGDQGAPGRAGWGADPSPTPATAQRCPLPPSPRGWFPIPAGRRNAAEQTGAISDVTTGVDQCPGRQTASANAERDGAQATPGMPGATWYDFAGDGQTSSGAASAWPCIAAARPRPDRPGVCAAAQRRG